MRALQRKSARSAKTLGQGLTNLFGFARSFAGGSTDLHRQVAAARERATQLRSDAQHKLASEAKHFARAWHKVVLACASIPVEAALLKLVRLLMLLACSSPGAADAEGLFG
ncbi:hypothetical protein T492DRAFT_846689 [Pavlovales sp. CCMP2436]|nr:hypothetical protein T492DRAFT_846689 [Pavlovales sp. CCMP2436]